MCGIAKDHNAAGQVFIRILSPFSQAIEAQQTLEGKAFHMQFVLLGPVAGHPARMQRGDLPVRAPDRPVRIVGNGDCARLFGKQSLLPCQFAIQKLSELKCQGGQHFPGASIVRLGPGITGPLTFGQFAAMRHPQRL